MRLLASVSIIACASLLASGCTDTTGIPKLSPTHLAGSMMSGRRATYPNSRKYRDAGFHPASGRSGTAAISARALIGQSGTTDVEVTTGSFDDAAPTGTLASVQVKGYTPTGGKLVTRNHTNLSGGAAVSFPYTNLPAGAQLQIQALVRNIDGSRTDVVSVSDVVHMRPDLVALSVNGPAEAPLGVPVVFHAFIMESHGEIGARASCVLYVDGVPADRADGIWVDAGGVVACAMSHIFTTAGTHGLELRVENVRPGDYDDSNNGGATTIICVGAPSCYSTYGFQAQSVLYDTWSRNISTLTRLDGIVETWDQTVSEKGPRQFASIDGLIPRVVSFPITLQGEMATNGTTVNSLNVTNATGEPAYWLPGAFCGTSFGANNDTYVCTYDSGYLAGYTSIQYDWWGADVRYHSASYVTSWDPRCENNLCQSYIVNDYSLIGPLYTFGPDFRGRISVQGAGDPGPTTAMTTIPLSPISFASDFTTPGCLTTPVSMSCHESHIHGAGIWGYVNYGSWPPYVP